MSSNKISSKMTTKVISKEISLSDSTEWVQGYFSKGTETIDQKYIKVNTYFELPDPAQDQTIKMQFSSPKVNLRMMISEFDKDKNFVEDMDLCDYALIYLKSKTKYITISIYEYKDAKVVNNQTVALMVQCENIKLTIMDDESLNSLLKKSQKICTGELTGSDLSNLGIYQYGSYASWGDTYAESTALGPSYLLFQINPNVTYFFNCNDSRYGITLTHYDSDLKYLYTTSNGKLTNGMNWKSQFDKAAYCRVKAGISQWNLGLDKLCGIGLWCNFSKENKEFVIEHKKITEIDFSNMDNYMSGSYYTGTGSYIISDDSLCVKYFVDLNGDFSPRRVRTGSSYFQMFIIQMDSSGKVLSSSTQSDGMKFTPSQDTSYLAITLNNSQKYVISDYEKYFQQKPKDKISIKIREKYKYNKTMKDINAFEYVDSFRVAWNLGNSLDSIYGQWKNDGAMHSNETTWGNIVVTEDLIDYVKSQGFDGIRIPVTWYLSTYLDENNHYLVNKDWLDRVQDIVDYAIKRDMYVLLNTHFDAGRSDTPIRLGQEEEKMNEVYKYCNDLWTEIAKFFKDYDEHLAFESYNEVQMYNSGFCYSETGCAHMNKINQIFVDAVRSTGGNNENRVLCVQTYSSNKDSASLDDFKMPDDIVENKIIAQVHWYPTDYDQSVEATMKIINEFSERIEAPVVVGEFGVKANYTVKEYIPLVYSNFIARCDQYGIKVYVWDDGNAGNFGVIDRRNFENSKMPILKALQNPKAYKTQKITILTDYDKNFAWMTLNQSTGAVSEDKYWGTIITDRDGYGIEIPKGTNYVLAGTVKSSSNNTVSTINLQYMHFYDEKMTFLKAYNSGNTNYRQVPEGAKYLRLGINSSYHATTSLMYSYFFKTKQLCAYIKWINVNDQSDPAIDNFDGSAIDVVQQVIPDTDLYINYDDIDIESSKSWTSGTINYATRFFEDNEHAIRTGYMILDRNFGGNGYEVYYATTQNDLRLTIYQFNEDFKALANKTLTNVESFKLDPNIKYIALVLSNPYSSRTLSYTDYIGILESDTIDINILESTE